MANQVNGNAVQLKEEEEPMDTSSVTHTEHYKTLIEAGLPQKVAERLDEIFQTGIICISCFWLVMKVRANHVEFYRFLRLNNAYCFCVELNILSLHWGHIGFDFDIPISLFWSLLSVENAVLVVSEQIINLS